MSEEKNGGENGNDATMTLKQRIQKMSGDDESIKPEEFANLILDDTHIGQISEEDGKYLSTFINLESLSLNATGLNSLANLPAGAKMVKLALSDNKLNGEELKKLEVYADSL